MLRKQRIATFLILASLLMSALDAAGQTAVEPGKPAAGTTATAAAPSSFGSIHIGRSTLRDGEFNQMLRSQQNNPLEAALEFAGEIDALTVPIPGIKTVSIKVPVGVHIINASSKTLHGASGATAMVNWHLPMLGIYVSPRVSIRRQAVVIHVRPVGVGYYTLGQGPIKAELSVSDRPGSLRARGTAWGYVGLAGIEYPVGKTALLVDAGYRRLLFNDVSLTPENGFVTAVAGVPAQIANLQQSLDFSGFTVRVGIGFRF